MNYQWYPGHMTKAVRSMQEDIKLVDLVVEVLDARIPISSRNPDIDSLANNKARLVLLNKADLADNKYNEKWVAYFKDKGITALLINAKTGNGLKGIQAAVQEACKEKIERDRKRGIKNRPVRAMVVGIPNVGKSTFINAYAGRACAKTGNKPGVTKGKQWIRLGKNLELLDTPGILWPKFESQIIGRNIAFIGSMNDQIIQIEELALDLIEVLEKLYPGILKTRYEEETPIKIETEDTKVQMLYQICESRKCYKKGEEYDTEKAAALLMDDFRNGRLGRITLEQDVGGLEKSRRRL